MKIWIVMIVLASSPAAWAIAPPTQDKLLHATGSALAMAVLARANVNPLVSFLLVSSLGVLKERCDKNIDKGDLIADAVGVSFGLVFHFK